LSLLSLFVPLKVVPWSEWSDDGMMDKA
jgi:hypothetical protein